MWQDFLFAYRIDDIKNTTVNDMKIKYKNQKFQTDAVKAVVNVFAGQQQVGNDYALMLTNDFKGNAQIELTEADILSNINKIQRENQITPSKQLEGKYNLTIEMETGVGKTYTYIKTMYELNKHYGWSKFIVVVPSIAIREGVYKTFQMTQEHFLEDYGERINFFIYDSKQLTNVRNFAASASINAMIINVQSFNANSNEARRIYLELDEFHSRKPIDLIAEMHPILIIDEPQSVEGKIAKERLPQFNPLFTLRYSATHRDFYNLIYRLDALDAYNKKLVKKIAVKGISTIGSANSNGFVYFESINLSDSAPMATIQFNCKTKNGVRQITRKVVAGFNLYEQSGSLEEYADNYIIESIDGRDNSITFRNKIKMFVTDVIGSVNENQIRRIQIRETILSHIERERQLFNKGIKVLSLFFIDEVANYKVYEDGQAVNGILADMFIEEYNDVIANLPQNNDDYQQYLESIPAEKTHAGYFSIDKKNGHIMNSKTDRKMKISEDVDAYDLIMRNKELLLDINPSRSPVRFIFSHSALREGWDNPNVFQICTLKTGRSDIRKRQEIGRGLRLCVNQTGERMDTETIGSEVHDVNILTVIASESYEQFVKTLQTELSESIADRPRAVTKDIFIGKTINIAGNDVKVDEELAEMIVYELTVNRYIDRKGALTDKYFADIDNIKFEDTNIAGSEKAVKDILSAVYSNNAIKIINPHIDNIEQEVDKTKLLMPAFKKLWSKINLKTVYNVNFDTDELIQKAITSINLNLKVPPVYFKVDVGQLNEIKSKEAMQTGQSFDKVSSSIYQNAGAGNSSIKYDLIGKLVAATDLTRSTIIKILTGIDKNTFIQFKNNAEEFIIKAANLINDEKAAAIVEHITYNCTNETYKTDIFTNNTLKGQLNINAIKTNRSLYNCLIYDSQIERKFAEELDVNTDVDIYVKLPKNFYISTPIGNYNPDWAIAFKSGNVKHIYFVAETKGSMDSMQLRLIERAKINCAREHFKTISNDDVEYDVITNFIDLYNKNFKSTK